MTDEGRKLTYLGSFFLPLTKILWFPIVHHKIHLLETIPYITLMPFSCSFFPSSLPWLRHQYCMLTPALCSSLVYRLAFSVILYPSLSFSDPAQNILDPPLSNRIPSKIFASRGVFFFSSPFFFEPVKGSTNEETKAKWTSITAMPCCVWFHTAGVVCSL